MKQIPVTIKVSNYELDCLEDMLMCVPLCTKHSKAYLTKETINGRHMESMYLYCKECEKIRRKWFKRAWFIQCRLYQSFLDEVEVI
jgi:hypothetical protein